MSDAKNEMPCVVIDARTGQVYAPTPPFQWIAIALDLPDDLWHDFKFFAAESRKAEETGDAMLRYRYVRASLFSLFGHVNAIFDLLIESRKSDSDFQTFKRAELPKLKGTSGVPRCEHGQFMVLLNQFVAARQNVQLPKVNFEVKLLRNVLAHPTGRKTDVTVPDLYNLDLSELETSAKTISAWLEAACGVCGVQRRIDTKEVVEKITEQVTGHRPETTRF